jgi:uncharacterized Zn finger protein
MAKFSKTWWGERFIAALERFTDTARLRRGRSYASGGRVLALNLSKGKISAKVRGKKNPYFGVYKEPTYNTTIQITPISKSDWTKLIKSISASAGMLSKLLMNEMPDNIEDVFKKRGLNLLPANSKDFITDCSCPDWANPCKHIAGVYYLVAGEFDRDPFLMFELRGLSKEELQKELAKSPLGKALLSELEEKEVSLESASSYYTRPQTEPFEGDIDLKTFWTGSKRLPQTVDVVQEAAVPAILIKKQGDYPAFWDSDVSFIETMEEFYLRVRSKNAKLL